MFDIGLPELILILVIILLLFGGKKLPEVSKSIAQGVKELRKGFSDDVSEKPTTSGKSEDTTPKA
jgi:sec-independent protein translocase protein TatA